MQKVINAQAVKFEAVSNVQQMIEFLNAEIFDMAKSASNVATKLEKVIADLPWFEIQIELDKFEQLEAQASDIRAYVVKLHLYALEELNEVFPLVARAA